MVVYVDMPRHPVAGEPGILINHNPVLIQQKTVLMISQHRHLTQKHPLLSMMLCSQ